MALKENESFELENIEKLQPPKDFSQSREKFLRFSFFKIASIESKNLSKEENEILIQRVFSLISMTFIFVIIIAFIVDEGIISIMLSLFK